MIIIPAIDLKDGKCVRLIQGEFDRITVYSDNPVDAAKNWQDKGAERLHIVDLDGSRIGSPQNKKIIRKIAHEVDIPIQVGGGIRDMKIIEDYLGMGISQVIVGTAALKNREFVISACKKHKNQIILGIDARNGKIAVEGWTEETTNSAMEIAKSYEGIGLSSIIYTDINRDGMEMGVNIESTRKLAESVGIPIIASGGVSGIQDIEKLLETERSGVIGVIVGKALYTGALDLKAALQLINRN